MIWMMPSPGLTQVTLSADGEGDTYELITSILAPGQDPIEVPDCNHEDFGRHIEEVYDNDVASFVFKFILHVEPDDDRCLNFDRQRNEIKTYSQSPTNLLAIEGEQVMYRWKFKLPLGFQTSPNFTHLHQIKPVGGENESLPMYTLTARKASPDRMELRFASTGSQSTLTQVPLEPFYGEWVEVTETITYGNDGTYALEIKKVSDGEILMEYSNNDIQNWRPGVEFARPKWGIYRSLDNAQDLRDEEVLFNDFSILETISSTKIESSESEIYVQYPNKSTIRLEKIPSDIKEFHFVSTNGQTLISKVTLTKSSVDCDVSELPKGVYFITFKGEVPYKPIKVLVP